MLENIITLGYENEKYSLIDSHFVYVTYLCYEFVQSFKDSEMKSFQNAFSCYDIHGGHDKGKTKSGGYIWGNCLVL